MSAPFGVEADPAPRPAARAAPVSDQLAPGSDLWWAHRLCHELVERRPRVEGLWARYSGNGPLPELGNPSATRTRQRVWQAFQRKARMNLAELVILSVLERLTPIGARVESDPGGNAGPVGGDDGDGTGVGDQQSPAGTGARPADGDDGFNRTARRIWRGNHMPVQAGTLIEKMLVMGESYTITGPPDPADPTMPIITVEDPRYVITAADPARPYRDIAGVKLYADPVAGTDVLVLHRPGRSVRFERDTGLNGTAHASGIGNATFRFDPDDWRVTEISDLSRWIGDRLAISRFTNHGGVGEFEAEIDHLDRVDHMILQRIIVATLQAFKQRAVKGVPTRDPRTGEKIDYSDVFTNDPGALWLLPATADLWESGAVDLTPLLSAVRDDVRDLAAVLRLPIYNFIPDAASGSAEGAAAAREGLIWRAEDRQARCDDGFADMFALAFSYLPGPEGDDPLTVTPLWAPVERHSLEARFAAAAQAKGVLPWEDIMTDVLGYAPDALPRLREHREADQALADARAEAELARTTAAELEKGEAAAEQQRETAERAAAAQPRPAQPPGGPDGA